MAVDLGDQGPPGHERVPHLQPIDAQGHVVDVHEVDAEGCGEAGLLRLIGLVRGFRDEGEVALDALQVQVLEVPALAHSRCPSCRPDDCGIQHLLQFTRLEL